MKTEHINELLKHPDHLSAGDLSDLQNLVRDYPWCQSFQLLYAKALKLNDDPGFNHQLKKTAIYASDRKILYRLIMQPGLHQSISDFETLTQAPVEEKETISDHKDSVVEEDLVEDIPNSEVEDKTTTAKNQSEESDPIDSSNLEKELLKEVAARAYQIEFESSPPKEVSDKRKPTNQPADQHAPEIPKSEPKKPMSFIDFITGGTPPSVSSDKTEESESEKAEESLIARFIQNEPKIERKKSSFFSPANMGKMSLVDNNEMVTETLADIYAKQGDTDKARRAYEQLALKYPEKSIYFAGLIKKMEEYKPKK